MIKICFLFDGAVNRHFEYISVKIIFLIVTVANFIFVFFKSNSYVMTKTSLIYKTFSSKYQLNCFMFI